MNHLPILLSIIISISCSTSVEQAQTAYTSELKELILLKGHDPVSEKALSNPGLKKRLVSLMGQNKYDTLVRSMYDCSPIGFNSDLIYWVGYGENNPESTGGAIIIDLANDEIYVGFEIGDKIRTYSEAENVDKRPNKLKLWLKRREGMGNTANEAADTISTN